MAFCDGDDDDDGVRRSAAMRSQKCLYMYNDLGIGGSVNHTQ